MSTFGRLASLTCACTLASLPAALGAGSASATTFFVDGQSGNDANACTATSAPCRTIGAAVTRSEADPAPATVAVAVAAGTYEESVGLTRTADSGITIAGAGSGAGGTRLIGTSAAKAATVSIALPGSSVRLSNISIVNQPGDKEAGILASGDVSLTGVVVDMRAALGASAIEGAEVGSLALHGGGVSMEGGSDGTAVLARNAALSIEGASISVAAGSTASGVRSEFAPMSLAATSVSMPASGGGPAVESVGGAASLRGVSIAQDSAASSAPGLDFLLPSSVTLDGVDVRMTNAASKAAGIEQVFGTGDYGHLDVAGAWRGVALEGQGAAIALHDSRVAAGSEGSGVLYLGSEDGPGLSIRRSVVQAAASAPAALTAIAANVTVDSSEILGGRDGVFLEQGAGKARTLTLASSTIDAGTLGVADGAAVSGVEVAAGPASVANANIEGSIVLEAQTAVVGAKGTAAAVRCTNSDTPSQRQAAEGEEGSIECGAGESANSSSPAASLFAAPVGAYILSPSSGAVDSVPAGAVSLPFGLAASSTDLAGAPRAVDGNGDCLAVQDMGALELQGHGSACPQPLAAGASFTSARPGAAVLSGMRISPAAFFAAPAGATVAATRGHGGHKRYGASVTWRDSQAASTTMTVLRVSSGRRQGRSCRRPSRRNRRAGHCRILTPLGAFAHADRAGANGLRFSGRLRGRRLARGAYRLQAVAHTAAGNSAPSGRDFTIR